MQKMIPIENCSKCPYCVQVDSLTKSANGYWNCNLNEKDTFIISNVYTIHPRCGLTDVSPSLPPKSMFILTADREVLIFNGMGKQTGKVIFGENSFSFEGSVEESADKFFSFIKYIFEPFMKKG